MGEEQNVFKAVVIFIIGAIGAAIGVVIAGLFSSNTNRQRVSDNKDSARKIDIGLTDSKAGIDRSKERIDAGSGSIDSSIDRIKDSLDILESAKNRSDDLSSK
jgi:hypothetical protein